MVRYYRKPKFEILVVDDDRDIQSLLSVKLQDEGYLVTAVGAAEDGLACVRRKKPDLIVLDINLPGTSGLEVCRQLHSVPKTRDIPIIFLTAKDDAIDRVIGLELGADDYLSKPFNVRELTLRIGGILKRLHPQDASDAPIQIGVLSVDVNNHLVRVKNKNVELTNTEFKLLARLIEKPGQVRTRDLLLESIWDYGEGVCSRTIDTHMQRLRAKLKEAGCYIETVRGVGYRFHSEE